VRVNALVAKANKMPEEGWIMQDGTPWPGNNTQNHPAMIQVLLLHVFKILNLHMRKCFNILKLQDIGWHFSSTLKCLIFSLLAHKFCTRGFTIITNAQGVCSLCRCFWATMVGMTLMGMSSHD
jgi:hypothetical protein